MNVNSMIQRGDITVDRRNQRIKVHAYDREGIPELHEAIGNLAREAGASKLIIYAKKADVTLFQSLGYHQEGIIDGFFHGENAQMLSAFLTEARAASRASELAEEILQISLTKGEVNRDKLLQDGFTLREATPDDADELACLYKTVFAAYPTPMDDPLYVRQTMKESTYYYVVQREGMIVCAASAEVTERFGSAELTDCATHPDHLGKGLLQPLFTRLEERMQEMGIYYLYTLTRAQSAGMNITAAKQGYRYRGRLINNCTIFSGFEDMNIWVKPLRVTRE